MIELRLRSQSAGHTDWGLLEFYLGILCGKRLLYVGLSENVRKTVGQSQLLGAVENIRAEALYRPSTGS